MLASTFAYSHPHSFITLKTTFYIQNDQLSRLHLVWTMDELTSSYLQIEYQQNPTQTLTDLVNNIAENNIFSEFSIIRDGKKLPIELSLQKEEAVLTFNNHKATVDFWLKLKHPLAISNSQFELMTYERTFYVDMYYEQDSDITINHNNCQIIVDKPKPSDEILNYAQALDENETAIETDSFVLGKIFSQKVLVSCK